MIPLLLQAAPPPLPPPPPPPAAAQVAPPPSSASPPGYPPPPPPAAYAAHGDPPAPSEPPPAATVAPPAPPRAEGERAAEAVYGTLRVMVGVGGGADSPASKALEADGYRNRALWWVGIDGAWSKPIAGALNAGVGPFVRASFMKISATRDSHSFSDQNLFAGAQVPLSIRTGTDHSRIGLTGYLGYGLGNPGIGSSSDTLSTLAYGGEFSFWLPDAHLAFAVGYLTGRASTKGDLGMTYALGGLYFQLGGTFGG